MIKKLFLTTQLLFCCFVLHSYARNEYASDSDRDLKRRNKMVKEAALLTGFNSQQNFIRVFKKYEGITPGQYKASATHQQESRK